MTSPEQTGTPAPLRVGLVQMRTGRDVAANLDVTRALVREAAQAGARYVQTPEMTNIIEHGRAALFEAIVEEGQDKTLAALRELARDLRIHLHIGSLGLKVSENRAVNRAFLITPDGAIAARYDKIHMFNVDLGNGETYNESAAYTPGDRAVLGEVDGIRFGLSICYDLRFPALFRALAEAGAQVLTVPAAFTRPTGEAHWHVLLRARAIENGAFVLAAAQGGLHENGRETYGHSLVVDPWGRILAEGGTEPGILIADLDLGAVEAARRRIPSLSHGRRFEVEGLALESRLHLVGEST
ncbi:carbon-nitrogen hydrolase family protein [Xanthobacter sp. TB0136]|uniref:carbon-nitrogen hydrolase family protein n=1 Tax=Xanthobacter sp. TB0136 TaxID=3459177 RepID=UPI0040398EEB